jgi:hypothetical protein
VQSLPTTPEDLTPAWLTAVLREAGAITASHTVETISHDRLGEGAGFIGIVARVSIRYDGDANGAVPTLIAKFPSPDEGARTIGNMYGLYEREVHFYNDLATEVGVPTPRCYFAAWEATAGQSLVLLEDLGASGRVGDQVEGCSLERAQQAITNLARFHGRWCDATKLAAIPWLQDGVELVRTSMTQAYTPSEDLFLELFGARLHPDIRAVIPGLGERVMRMMDDFVVDRRLTLAHGDYRLDNLFFGGAAASYDVAVIDWQSPNRGWGAYDVAYFISGSFPTEQRRAYEQRLLRAYFDAFSDVVKLDDYTFDQLFDDYRRSLLVYLALFVINGATLELTNERAVQLFNDIFDRLNAALVDLKVALLLPA